MRANERPFEPSLPPEALTEAFVEERRCNARLQNHLRWIAVSLFLAITLLHQASKPAADGYRFPILLGTYWLVSLAMALTAWRFPRVALWSGLAVPLVDMPIVFMIQAQSLAYTESPRAVANFTVGVYVCLVMLAAMSLQRSQVQAAAAVGVGCQFVLHHLAQDTTMGKAGGVVLIMMAAALCELARRRRLEMMALICGQRLRRERLVRFFSPQVADQIERQADNLEGGRRCEVTVLFADIRDFTALSEKLDSDRLVALLNDFHGRMVEAIFAHGGTLDKYTGDGVMAYFGAPLPQPDHPERAVRCAMAMQQALAELNQGRTARGEPPIRMGIGVHSGPALVGTIGAPHRREFTVVGDTVNLASRLEQLTKLMDEPILVSQETRERMSEQTTFRRLEATSVKGKAALVNTYVPIQGSLADRPSGRGAV